MSYPTAGASAPGAQSPHSFFSSAGVSVSGAGVAGSSSNMRKRGKNKYKEDSDLFCKRFQGDKPSFKRFFGKCKIPLLLTSFVARHITRACIAWAAASIALGTHLLTADVAFHDSEGKEVRGYCLTYS